MSVGSLVRVNSRAVALLCALTCSAVVTAACSSTAPSGASQVNGGGPTATSGLPKVDDAGPGTTAGGGSGRTDLSGNGVVRPGELPYAHTKPSDVQGNAAKAKPLVYVPNQRSSVVQVIDPRTYTIVDRFPVGRSPEHVVPNPDMSTLWVNSDTGNSMTPVDPVTGKPGTTIPIDDPYNLYFTPNGSLALVMAERLRRIDVRDARTMALQRSLAVPCRGLNHADYTADLQTLLASCEFSGKLLVVDSQATKVEKVLDLNAIETPGATSPEMGRRMGGPKASLEVGASAMPQDVRLSPDGRWFLAADMLRNGVWVINASTMVFDRFIPTGLGAHGIYPSRDATKIYVSNRDEGSVSVLDAASLTVRTVWRIPGGGSPDMGGVSVDGKELWLSGRYNSVVYVLDTTTGQVTHKIAVDAGPHGLLVWPQPGRFSLGHTGNTR